jgi:hypothetical protein
MTPIFNSMAVEAKGKCPIYLWRWFHRKMAIPLWIGARKSKAGKRTAAKKSLYRNWWSKLKLEAI